MKNIWFSIYDKTLTYKGIEPDFYSDLEFDWAHDLKKNTDVILQELKCFLNDHELPNHFSTSMVNKKNSWKPISLKTWSIEHFKTQQQFPKTTALIQKYPEIISVSFNLLQAESDILPHCGDTNAILRCHLGLEIPGNLPECGFKVNDSNKSWEKGQWIIFLDAYPHTAWNQTSGDRYILLIDILRPEFQHKKNYICSTVITSLFLQRRMQKYAFLKRMPFPLLSLFARFLQPFSLIGIKWVNIVKKY